MKKRFFLTCAVLLLLAVLWVIRDNTALEVNEFTLTCVGLPDSFHGFRIAQVSDLHNDEFGADNETLLTMLRDARPDIIVITGDLLDSYDTNADIALHFASEAAKIAPCYYVTGNHEARIGAYSALRSEMEAAGVTVLSNQAATLERSGGAITLLGVDDLNFQSAPLSEVLAALVPDMGYTVLLSHRPELFDTYAAAGVDLVFSGHAHGGQFRLPFVGGLFAPGQGIFPEYDSGLYSQGRTTMVVSRGIGNSAFPFRFNNPPEIILVELQSAEGGN